MQNLLCHLSVASLVFLGALAASPQKASAQPSSTVVAQNSGLCLDVGAFRTDPGLPMEQYTCNEGSNQSFTFTPAANGHYLIQPQSDGFCLDTSSSQVVQNPCSGAATQQWTLQAAGTNLYSVVSSAGSCMNVQGYSNQNSANMILWECNGQSNEMFAISGLQPPTHLPTGITGSFQPLIDATFGSGLPDATVKSRADLDKLAYYWFEYGPSTTDPAFWAQADAPNNCMGPRGDGADGLYGNFESRFMHCSPGSQWDRHVLSADRLTLKANCGLQDNNPANCGDANIGGGMLRFITSFRPTADHPIVVEMKGIMPKGMYSWPAFWINPGEQSPRNADGSPGALLSATWPPEIDIFDQFGFNNAPPGHDLIMGTPTNGNDAAYASSLCQPQNLSVCDLPLTPGGANLPTTSVAQFNNWYATTNADLTADWHVYSVHIYPDHVDALLDGVVYRSRGYTWPASSPPMQLLVSNQTGAKFNDLSKITDQGGVANGWDWAVAYVRVWQQN